MHTRRGSVARVRSSNVQLEVGQRAVVSGANQLCDREGVRGAKESRPLERGKGKRLFFKRERFSNVLRRVSRVFLSCFDRAK